MHLTVTFLKLISLQYLQEEQYYIGYASQQVTQSPLLLPIVIYMRYPHCTYKLSQCDGGATHINIIMRLLKATQDRSQGDTRVQHTKHKIRSQLC